MQHVGVYTHPRIPADGTVNILSHALCKRRVSCFQRYRARARAQETPILYDCSFSCLYSEPLQGSASPDDDDARVHVYGAAVSAPVELS